MANLGASTARRRLSAAALLLLGVAACDLISTRSGVLEPVHTTTATTGSGGTGGTATTGSGGATATTSSSTTPCGACAAETLIAPLPEAESLAVDATYVYWAEAQAVRKMPRAGGPPVTVADPLPNPRQLQIRGDHLYWVTSAITGLPFPHAVMRAPLSGGAAAKLGGTVSEVYDLVVDGAHAYWTEGFVGELRRVPVSGGAVEILATGLVTPGPLAVDDAFVYWADKGTQAAQYQDGGIYALPKAGGARITLAPASDIPWGLAVDATDLYSIDLAGYVRKVPLGGGKPVQLAYLSLSGIFLTLHGDHVYWTAMTSTEGGVFRVPRAGGAVETLASMTMPEGIAVDQESVIWARYGSETQGFVDGAVYRLPTCCVP